MQITTGANSITIYILPAKWKGEDIYLTNCQHPNCLHPYLDVVHHYDDEGNHYCPTMFLMCPECGGLADEPEPYSCNLWGIKESNT